VETATIRSGGSTDAIWEVEVEAATSAVGLAVARRKSEVKTAVLAVGARGGSRAKAAAAERRQRLRHPRSMSTTLWPQPLAKERRSR
jgi:hypothetical protein